MSFNPQFVGGESANERPVQQGPNGGVKFRVIPVSDNGNAVDGTEPFAPAFYPDRFNQTSQKELRREGQQCRGEDVSIKKFKNATFHATGIVLEDQLRILQELLNYDGKVDMITPVSPQGGLECYIKKGEVGEIEGWHPGTAGVNPQWMFNYTLDFVSTGEDEFGNTEGNSIVSNALPQSGSGGN